MRSTLPLVLAGTLLLSAAGCFQPSLISPEPLAAGDVALGIAGTFLPNREGIPAVQTVSLHGRVGLGCGVDAGLRLTIPSGPYADLKWNLLSRPFLLTADLGAFYEEVEENDLTEHLISDTVAYGFCPALLAGTSWAYAGLRISYRRGFGHRMSPVRPGWTVSPSVLLGGSFGDHFLRVMPLAELVWFSNGARLFVGLNLEYDFRSRSERGHGGSRE